MILALGDHPEEDHLVEDRHAAGPGVVLLVVALQPQEALVVLVIEHTVMARKILQE